MENDKINEILGDLTVFIGLLILQAHNYDDEETRKDKETYAKMMSDLSEAIGLTPEDVIAITQYAENDMRRRIDGKIKGDNNDNK
jgi:hypothetical protein